ncbi:MAG: methylenetetrahydrofolate reductase [NAD(P)H] [Bacteroidales bacterium]|jgi:methylenetetrahydrofolate reductase (NADPH)|nr:methylenetetrahydrofolate reductase [NAD(P)H] [Bacteroidales bacterium]
MSVAEIIQSAKKTLFSFEILPPLKGKGLESIYNTINPLMDFGPKFINITSHREVYDANNNRVRRRPGTVAVAAVVAQQYGIPVVPHILCGGFSRKETEYVLIDLNFLGITDIFALRGDSIKHSEPYKAEPDGNTYARDLLVQIADMNKGKYLDDSDFGTSLATKFSCGVAGYPEKHYAAVNLESDIRNLKAKVDAGAQYIITQMFFDNAHYFNFVKQCRAEGITVPIVPGIKPIGFKNQVDVLPQLFHLSLPQELEKSLRACTNDEDARKIGTEWAIMQAKELVAHNVPLLHLYTYSSAQQCVDILKAAL